MNDLISREDLLFEFSTSDFLIPSIQKYVKRIIENMPTEFNQHQVLAELTKKCTLASLNKQPIEYNKGRDLNYERGRFDAFLEAIDIVRGCGIG